MRVVVSKAELEWSHWNGNVSKLTFQPSKMRNEFWIEQSCKRLWGLWWKKEFQENKEAFPTGEILLKALTPLYKMLLCLLGIVGTFYIDGNSIFYTNSLVRSPYETSLSFEAPNIKAFLKLSAPQSLEAWEYLKNSHSSLKWYSVFLSSTLKKSIV